MSFLEAFFFIMITLIFKWMLLLASAASLRSTHRPSQYDWWQPADSQWRKENQQARQDWTHLQRHREPLSGQSHKSYIVIRIIFKVKNMLLFISSFFMYTVSPHLSHCHFPHPGYSTRWSCSLMTPQPSCPCHHEDPLLLSHWARHVQWPSLSKDLRTPAAILRIPLSYMVVRNHREGKSKSFGFERSL